MKRLRSGDPSSIEEEWDREDIMNYLNCDSMKASKLLEEIHSFYNSHRYGSVPKEWVLDYLAEKDRVQREREMRYKSDLSNVESIAILKEQVSTLKEISSASSADARKARNQAQIANVISVCSLLIALLALIFK